MFYVYFLNWLLFLGALEYLPETRERVWGFWWKQKKRKACLRIVINGRKWSLPIPMGNGRNVIILCFFYIILIGVYLPLVLYQSPNSTKCSQLLGSKSMSFVRIPCFSDSVLRVSNSTYACTNLGWSHTHFSSIETACVIRPLFLWIGPKCETRSKSFRTIFISEVVTPISVQNFDKVSNKFKKRFMDVKICNLRKVDW
jgi:hypothetical protein